MLHLEDSTRRSGDTSQLAARQPSVYATRLAKQPTVIANGRELEHLKATYRHAPAPACVSLRCQTCRDLLAVEQLLGAGRPVALHPIYPIEEGSPRRAK